MDPHLSPDGSMLAYVKDKELYVLCLANWQIQQLTFGARGYAKVSLSFQFLLACCMQCIFQ